MHNLDHIWFPKHQAHIVTSYPMHNSMVFIHLGQNPDTAGPTHKPQNSSHSQHEIHHTKISTLNTYDLKHVNLDLAPLT